MDNNDTTYDVLVIGAGPAGLVTATSLAHHGVRTLVVERHPGTSPFPKATGVSTRTMEIMHTWGLEADLLEGAMPANVGFATAPSLREVPTSVRPFGYPSLEAARAVSPSVPAAAPQDHLEPVLADHLASHGLEVSYRTELVSVDADADGITACLHDMTSDELRRVRARYLVGADGPNSPVRTASGIDFEQLGGLGDHVAVLFRADIADVPPHRWAGYAIEGPTGGSLLIPSGRGGRWIYDRERDGDIGNVPDAQWMAEIRAAVGIPDLDVEIIRAFQFTIEATVAQHFRSGRVFIVGDAAHRTTPVGGIGMNTAIQSAHNLGWKLAWVVRGWADEALLDTYEVERRPVGFAAAWRSMHPEIFLEFDGLAAEMDLRYRSPAIVDGGLAGGRAPHRWLRPDLSTLDLFDGRLTLLTGPDTGDRWRSAAALLTRGLPFAVVALGTDVPDPGGLYAADLGLTDDGAALVRPDGHISWHLSHTPANPPTALAAAIATTLGRRELPAADHGRVDERAMV